MLFLAKPVAKISAGLALSEREKGGLPVSRDFYITMVNMAALWVNMWFRRAFREQNDHCDLFFNTFFVFTGL